MSTQINSASAMLKVFLKSGDKLAPINEFLAAVDSIPKKQGMRFPKENITFAVKLSDVLLKDREIKNFPEAAAFAFWSRKGNIEKIIKQAENSGHGGFSVPRGIALHIAPANVDLMFLYSWIISLLVGNINLVRLSQKDSAAAKIVLGKIQSLLDLPEFNSLKERNLFFTYEHNDGINEALSAVSDLRVIWGGDSTVKRFKKYETKITCKDVYFPDRKSYCAINSAKYLRAPEEEKKKLSANFYNDAFWFDQKACSSPLWVFFIGSKEENENAGKLFWGHLNKTIEEKEYNMQSSVLMDHLVQYYELASAGAVKLSSPFSVQKATAVSVEEYIPDLNSYENCGGGFFLYSFCSSASQLAKINSKKEQTITYFGFEPDELKSIIEEKEFGGACRIVPIGRALDFNVIWDGYNLIDEFSRIVSVL